MASNRLEQEHYASNRVSQIRTTISQAMAMIKDEHVLKLDGSNFKSWEMRISIILDDFIDDPSFLYREGPTLSSDEKICQGILIHSLPEAIQSKILHLRPCKAIYDHLRKLYYITMRAGQMVSLEELLNTQMHAGETPASYTLRVRAAANKFTQQGVIFNEDLLMGLIMQRGVKDQTFTDTLMMRLENEISNKGMNHNLATCQQLLESSFQQHQTQAGSPKQHGTPTYQQVSVKNDAPPPLDTYKDDTIDPAALKTVIWGICHNCKKPGHFARECQAAKAITHAGRNALQDATTVRPADYYRPAYQCKLMTPLNLRFAELGEDEDLMNLFQAEISEDKNTDSKEPVCDTGATHSLTNDCDALLNFCVLTTPLPLTSKGMNHWYTVRGITHEQSLPMNHEQNGCTERFNRSIADMGRTILRSSNLANAFWGYAFMWAAYTMNNLPNEWTGNMMPTEMLFNEKPHLEKM
ncbi:hypothetical protein O181_002834 [Austropuccinia psidii MF-1]|uniref:CCHC-type domain-containing protein n=1 Tax=Austropuccinia psidii MF-1 TaxID=1389203 RepID=A0A9Q3GD87_9BASI|nr:hypothetical protein [Austropuccinia psidii MF-1]